MGAACAASYRSRCLPMIRYSLGDPALQLHNRTSERAPRRTLRVLPQPPAPAERAERLSRGAYTAMIIGAVALGVLVRATIALSSDFPLNDGGMFFAMVRDLQASHYALPAFTTYNSSDIPFAYPPLGLYLAAFIDDATPVGLLTVFRFLPLIVSSFTLVAFLAFARRMLDSRAAVVTAVFVFGMLPATMQWMIMGGGLTRSLGFLFAILAIGQVHAMYTSRGLRRVPIVMVLASLVVLSHIEMAWLTAIVAALMFAAYGRTRTGVLASVAVAAGTLLLTSPWWATVLHQHGMAPFAASLHSGVAWRDPIFLLIRFDATVEPLFALVAALSLLGMFICLARRQYLLPSWVVAAAVLDPRAFPASASMAIALLAAISVHDVLLPLVVQPMRTRLSLVAYGDAEPGPPRRSAAPAWLVGAAFALGICYLTLSALVNSPSLLTGLKPDERDAMHWVATNTEPGARFAVVSADGWSVDRTSEWFPTLAARQSVATVQGSEWLTGVHGFAGQSAAALSLQSCANLAPACLDEWTAKHDKPFDYVYITKIPPRIVKQAKDPCCGALRAGLLQDARYTVVYESSAAIIFQRRL